MRSPSILQSHVCMRTKSSAHPRTGRRFLATAGQLKHIARQRAAAAAKGLIAPRSITIAMALQEVTASLLRRMRTQNTALSQAAGLQCRRYASNDSHVARELKDLEETDFVKPSEPDTKYDPLHRSRSFQGTPPSSRFVQSLSHPPANPSLTFQSQIQVPSPQVLPRPSTPSPTSQTLRSGLARVHSWSLLPTAPRTNLLLHSRSRSYDPGLCPPPTRIPSTTKRRASQIMAGRIAILQEPSSAWTQRWRCAETPEEAHHIPQRAQD